MDQVHPHLVWIGHAGDGRNHEAIRERGIRAVVQLALEEPSLAPPREIVYLRFPLHDGGGNPRDVLEAAIAAAAGLIALEIPTLICCAAGMSRAPALTAAALARANQEPPEACLALVLKSRRGDVSPRLWAEILEILEARNP